MLLEKVILVNYRYERMDFVKVVADAVNTSAGQHGINWKENSIRLHLFYGGVW